MTKLSVYFKTPDAVSDAVACHAKREGLDFGDRLNLESSLQEKWFPYGETVEIEVDVETMTAVVKGRR